jgi:hypothetical protein
MSVGPTPSPDMSTQPPPTGGGQLLNFAVFGDCRPPALSNVGTSYPTAILGGVFSIAKQNNAQFVIGTGDYMFTNTQAGVDAQVPKFFSALKNYASTLDKVWLTMGNHECNGYTASNCPALNETPNIQAFMGQLLPPGVTKPYYRKDVSTPLGTAKFIFVAANAWDSTQQTWLTQQLQQPTKYTFVMRHEPHTSSGVPTGVSASESIITQYPLTLEFLGHTHEYRHGLAAGDTYDNRRVISGNAGAPIQSTASFTNYGVLLVQQQSNGDITVNEIDESSGSSVDSWTVSP